MTEKIVVFNGYGGSNPRGGELAQWLNAMNADVAMVSEMLNLKDNLNNIGAVYGEGDVGIVVMNGANVDEFDHVRLTDFIFRGEPSPRLWVDRWYVRVKIGQRVYYSTHGNAAIAGPNGNWIDNAGANEWRYKGLPKLREAIKSDMDRGFDVRVGGDFNFPKSTAVSSPNNFFQNLGLHYMADRVMWLAWDPKTAKVEDRAILGIAPGADAHATLRLSLKYEKDLTDNRPPKDGGGGGGGNGGGGGGGPRYTPTPYNPLAQPAPYNPRESAPGSMPQRRPKPGKASLAGRNFRLDPTSIEWGFDTKIADIATVGGKVVQIFGTEMKDLVIEGTFGAGGWKEQERFLERMKSVADRALRNLHGKEAGRRNPPRFRYPPRGWDFFVYLKGYSTPDGGRSIVHDNQIIAPRWRLTLHVVEDNSGLKKIAQDAYLDRIAHGIGWKQTAYNGPMGSLESELGGAGLEDYLSAEFGIGDVSTGNNDFIGPVAPVGSGGGPFGTGGGGGTPEKNKALGRDLAQKMYGWTGSQWTALLELWIRESNWTHTADNPTSTAYGIPQALISAHSPMPAGYYDSEASLGRYTGGDPAVQIRWGLRYIKDRYGNPVAALNFHDANGYY